MSYLLDTNVFSELVRRRPSARVVRWVRELPDTVIHMSVLSLGEIRRGVERLDDGPRKERLRLWLEEDLPAWLEGRLLPVDAAVAERWGRLLASMPRSIPAIDGLLAATALHHELRLVTRNEKDFELPGLVVINPWHA